MGVSYDSMTYAGEYFDDVQQIAEMLLKQGVIEIDDDENCADFDSDTLSVLSGLDIQCENYWSGEGFYVGFQAYDWKGYQCLMDEYKRITGRDAEIHDFVQVS